MRTLRIHKADSDTVAKLQELSVDELSADGVGSFALSILSVAGLK